jgi:chemotaxis protein methyltransferase CheR
MSVKLSDFDLYRDLLYNQSGLVITPDKTYLLDSRLTPVAKKWGHETLDSMSVALRSFPDPTMVKDIVEAMTTNETSFYRDQRPFDIFEKIVLPAIVATRQKASKKIRIWCAAASTGQEPYSLAMLLKEKENLWRGCSVEIVATDISEEALAIAKAGAYSQFEVQRGLPIALLIKYFKQKEDKWQIADEIRAMIKYDYFNLLEDMKKLGSFDIIFCRNVLIYFDEKTKGQVLARMSTQIAADGFLFMGGAETTIGITDKFKPMEQQRGLYVRPDFPGLPAGLGPMPITPPKNPIKAAG